MVEDFVGKQIGPYQIKAFIGRGGMAFVYKAYQPSMDRFVAIKLLPYELHTDQAYLELFRKEAQLIAHLQHPHILPVYDSGETDAYVYIVMQLIERGTLFELTRGVPLTLGRIYDIASQVGSALAYAHSKDIVHRDVKPHNILIDEQGSCWLTDFGISKILAASSGLTSKGIIGTPEYMSPEQGIGKRVDARSDIYSLGVVLYEIVAGRLPFHAETPVATVFQHVYSEPLAPRTFNPNVPVLVEQVILKALAKDPDARYQKVTDMINALRNNISAEDNRLEFGPIPLSAAIPGFLSSFIPPDATPGATLTASTPVASPGKIPGTFDASAAPPLSYSSGAAIAEVVEEVPLADSDLISRLIARAKLGPWGYLDEGRNAIRALRVEEEEASRQRLAKLWEEERKRRERYEMQTPEQQRIEMLMFLGMAIIIVIALVLITHALGIY